MTQGMANNHQKEAGRAQDRSSLRTSIQKEPAVPTPRFHTCALQSCGRRNCPRPASV